MYMKTRKLIVSTLILLSLGLTACNAQTPDSSSAASSQDVSSDSSQAQPHEHTFGRVWRSDDTHHWHICTGTADDGQPCQEKSDYAEHTWDDGEVATPATTTASGSKKYTCTVCKRVKYEEIFPTSQEAYQEGEDENHVPIFNFHTDLQRQYLADEWTTNTKYIPSVNAEDRKQHDDLSVPTAITLDIRNLDDASKYYIQIADNSAFSNAKQFEATTKLYPFYNAKLGTQYYYRAATSEAGLSSAAVKTFKTSTQAPRNLKVDGVLNFRDVGGWSSSLVPNGRVKQGMYYRCGQFDSITAAGKETIKELGIKVDIDMRDNVPGSSPANSSGNTLTIVNASIASGTESQRFSGFASVYKTIFDNIKNADSKPIALHCTHGADRTGIASFFLLAVLGVSKEDCGRDYSFTRFAGQRAVKHEVEFDGWVSGTEAYASQVPSSVPANQKFAEEMKLHLLSKGISEDTIETIREKFIEGYTRP